MKDSLNYVGSLLQLPQVALAEQRALWRQALTTLAQSEPDGGPKAIDTLNPEALQRVVGVALAAGLADDLEWLAPSAAGVALYAIAAVLPVGFEQRELGRRVLARMLAGNAETFVAIATEMATGSGKGLGRTAVRARLSLVTEVPLSVGLRDGALALTIASRRELAREWIVGPSTRALPSRRLAAKLVERAAAEAARRASQGDTFALRAFASEAIRASMGRLQSDRESLVWRYVAAARGMIAPWIDGSVASLDADLAADLSPTEWRRAAAAVASLASFRPDEAMRLAHAAVARGLFQRDPGLASAFVWGLARTAELDPDAASGVLDLVLPHARADVAEATVELLLELGPGAVAEAAAERTARLLEARGGSFFSASDDGAVSLARELARDLDGDRPEATLRALAARGLDAFVRDGAQAAHSLGREALAEAHHVFDSLAALGDEDEDEGAGGALARRAALAHLRDLDVAILERQVVGNLLRLGGGHEPARAGDPSLERLHEHLAEWILAREATDRVGDGAPPHPTLHLRRLRAFLHLVDGETGDVGDGSRRGELEGEDAERARRARSLWTRSLVVLFERAVRRPAPMLRRTVLAALARAIDAVVRLGVCEAVDAVLVLAGDLTSPDDYATLAEAAMDEALRQVFSAYGAFLAAPAGARRKDALADLDALAEGLAPEGSARGEALRVALARTVAAARGALAEASLERLSLAGAGGAEPLAALEKYAGHVAQVVAAARTRILDVEAASRAAHESASAVVARAVAGAEEPDRVALAAELRRVASSLPGAMGTALSESLEPLAALPLHASAEAVAPPRTGLDELPAWLPPRRTLGGFYVVRSLGAGAVGSVLVATRIEDRHEPAPELFALKVPEYTATAARSVSEDEFLKMFRAEASALMAIPQHTNLATFVTFDLACRPKPILVMELVEGPTLERVLSTRALDMQHCTSMIDGVLEGLEAMHAVGVGHLDIKPSNVVLRGGEQAVLVDFGLAGRNIRQGCGTGPYGAPEVWGMLDDQPSQGPAPADVYSFACVAFEALTGQVLFDAPNEVAQIALHAMSDGAPPRMELLSRSSAHAPVAEVLRRALRRDPRARCTVRELRAGLRSALAPLADKAWPLG